MAIGFDLAKSVFQVHGVEEAGATIPSFYTGRNEVFPSKEALIYR